VAAREVLRLARNSRECQHLVEVCRVVDTVLIDQETVHARHRVAVALHADKAGTGHARRVLAQAREKSAIDFPIGHSLTELRAKEQTKPTIR
jgi:hypothetical protein